MSRYGQICQPADLKWLGIYSHAQEIWTEEKNPSVASVHTHKRVNSPKCMEQSLTTITTTAALEDHSPVFDVHA